jgi:copper chaperone
MARAELNRGTKVIQRYKVSGMTCGDCAKAVTKAVETLTMVERAFVDIGTSELVVEGEVEESAVRDLVAAAGYEVAGRI